MSRVKSAFQLEPPPALESGATDAYISMGTLRVIAECMTSHESSRKNLPFKVMKAAVRD